jgi:hypothetical protein
VSAEVVTLQLKQLGLTINPSAASGNNEKRSAPLPEVEQLTELPPSYEQTVGGSASSKSSDTELGRLAGRTMMARLQSLVKIVIHPLLVEHARRGHVAVCFYFVDVRFIPKEVATTIEDDLPVEWVLLADGSRLQNNNSAAYNPSSLLTSPCAFASSSSSTTPLNNNNDSLIATLRSVPGLTGDQIERLVAALRVTSTAASDSHSVPGNKPTSPVEDFPDTGYLLQTGVFEKIEPLIHKESNAISAKLERRDLTVRRENEYGLIESSSIIAVRLWVRIA